jgi:tetratricopeptide (TPR) repeat protein
MIGEMQGGTAIAKVEGDVNIYLPDDKPKAIGIPHNLPHSGARKFVGRDLGELHSQLRQADHLAITAIRGMGGIGKTELALQYAQHHYQRGTYPGGICWLQAREQEIATQIVGFARSTLGLHLPDDLELAEQVAYGWRHWPAGEVLVILDDVKDYAAIKAFLPPPNPRFWVLLTTRLKLGSSIRTFELQVLDETASLELLASLIGTERVEAELETAKKLCQWLGYLPLGLELAGRYLAQKPDLSLAQLRTRLEDKRLAAKALSQSSGDLTAEHENLAAAFELSWQELTEAQQSLAYLLSLFALAPIPWSAVTSCFAPEDEEDLEDWRDLGLVHRSLLQRTDQDTYQLHQLIREFFRAKVEQWPQADQLKQHFCQQMAQIAQQFPQAPTQAQVMAFTPLVPHVAEAATTLQPWLSQEDLIWPFVGLGRFYKGQGIYGQAEPWYQGCLNATRLRLGERHPDVATSLNNLAGLYESQGRYDAAEPLYQQALDLRRELLGERHPQVATSLNNLAGLYYAQGRYDAAEPFYHQALDLRRELLGERHPQVASSLNNLAALYYAQRRYAAAEPLYHQALDLSRELLGECHPQVATSLNNLAALYNAQGPYEAAEPLYLEALAILAEAVGTDHPNVQTVFSNFVAFLRAVVEANQTDQLSAHPLVKHLLAQMGVA